MARGQGRQKRSWASRIFSFRRRAGSAGTDEPGEERAVYVNVSLPTSEFDAHGRSPQYPPNQIRTAKYTIVSFVPKNLIEQFRRAANIYFLFLLILQFIPAVTTGMPGLSALALFTIVALTMAKDGYEDSRRSASDREANKAPAVVLGNSWVNTNKPPAHSFRPRGPLRFIWGDSGSEGTVGGATQASSSAHGTHDHYSNFGNNSFGMTPSGAQKMASDINIDSSDWLKTEWRHLHVGDIVLIRDGDSVPADVFLLNTSDEDGTCFVETKNLDGETNLKTKHASHKTTNLYSPAQFASFRCIIDAEPPNTQLYSFKGSLRILSNDTSYADQSNTTDTVARESLSVDNLLLRGSVVRNTKWAVGVIVFTGNETKIMMNAGETPSKRSRIERMMNYQVITQFCLLFILCLLTAILGGIYYGESNSFPAIFIRRYETSKTKTSPPLYGFLTFWTSLILYQTVVPISLYVTIEIVKLFQAYFINQDIDMYYAPVNRRCTARAWNLSDDLGQVEYIFSDKTGTLTQNVMVFRQCTIRGRVYGEIVGDDEVDKAKELCSAMDNKISQFFDNPYRQSETTSFLDTNIYDDLRADNTQARAVIEFFTILALCHNVISDTPDPSRPKHIEYKAQSPDEAALVSTARDVGFTFIRRDKDRVLCNFLGHEQEYQLLATLEFTSARKRMSVIVRREDGRIMLLCKGADSIIMERIRPNQERLRQATLDDLELFANHGLRTLCLGYRLIDEAEYTEWRRDYDVAMASLGDREGEVEEVCDRIERNLQLTGGTAIEDKLQDGVPETIAQLSLAGIKLWVLTGDKTETAINIGYSCNLLNNDMQLIVVKADDKDATHEQLERALQEFGDTHGDLSYIGGGGGPMSGVQRKNPGAWRRLLGRSSKGNGKNPAFQHAREVAQNKNHRRGIKGIWDDVRTRNIPVERKGVEVKHDAPLGLVIDGNSLKYALEPDLAPLLLELAVRCQSVLCCRVSPLQKALVVRLVKEGLGTLCLSIGDGANDVSMIQEADVGIGISGEEGLQAVMASDYAIAQFRFLQKLLLVHGRWSYLRITSMILNFFYKNVVFTVSLFWFQIFCQWSVSNMFDYTIISLYNMLFTSLPPGVLGVFDQDLPAFVGAVVPQLYKRGIYKLEYSMARFWMYIVDGLYQSAATALLVIYTYYFSSAAERNGLDSASKDDIGTVGAFCVILTTNLYMGLNNRSWTWVMPVAQLFGIALLLGVFFVYGVIYNTEFSAGAGSRVFEQVDFWFLLLLTTILCLFPHYLVKFVRSAWYPTDTDVVREIVHGFRKGKQKNFQSWGRPAYSSSRNYGVANTHKEVPFGAIPVQKASPTQAWRRQASLHGGTGHHMEGAIPLNDIGSHLSGTSSARGGSGVHQRAASIDALNGPGLYQGIHYPIADTALVGYLHNLSHMNASSAATATAQNNNNNILKRLSVHQQQRAPTHIDPSGENSRAVSEDVALQEDGNAVYHIAPLSRYASRASVRSSIYYLDDGTVEPYTGYAFAHQDQSSLASQNKGNSERSQRRIQRRQR
ncbi:phospholipid transporting ATPase [Coemansia spiralis]|uniref:Phospholipid-transporting ATPase n=2 Tax=Coemansia TaxID=4863 RepID=A0A9W8G7X7_9FUNG|nr:phospholipid transporting ATPase [Coemansia umbellata]KAJ2680597.1 phospholipid transporting ATPase [Coemansia spiralis]